MGLGRAFNRVGGFLTKNAQGIAGVAALVSMLVPGGQGLAAGLTALSGALSGTFKELYTNPDGSTQTVGGVRMDTILIIGAVALVVGGLLVAIRYFTTKRR